MDFGQRLASLRKARDMSQPDLERASGVSRSTIGMLESRRSRSPTAKIARKLAVGLGITVDQLLDSPEESRASDAASGPDGASELVETHCALREAAPLLDRGTFTRLDRYLAEQARIWLRYFKSNSLTWDFLWTGRRRRINGDHWARPLGVPVA